MPIHLFLALACTTDDADKSPDSAADTATDSSPGEVFSASVIGSPSFVVASSALFSAPLGGGSSLDPWMDTFEAVLPHHYIREGIQWSLEPHDYATELHTGVTAAGYTLTDTFAPEDAVAPLGLTWLLVLAPGEGAAVGATPDGDAAMIPTGSYPLTIDGTLSRDGVVIDEEFDGDRNLALPKGEYEGVSHDVMASGENSAWADISVGAYIFRLEVVDAAGGGWLAETRFVVE